MSKLEEKKLNKGPDLSDLNKPRGEGLADLIPPAPAPEESVGSETAPEAPVPAGAGTGRSPGLDAAGDPADESNVDPSTTVDREAEGDTRTPADRQRAGKDFGAVYVNESVRKRFDKYRHDQRLTNAQVVLKAVSDLHSELPEVIAAAKYSTAPVDPLFPADPSAVKYLGGGPAQIVYATTEDQAKVLDTIGEGLGFKTRSTWLAPVLNAFLPGRKERGSG